jgi:hypothetical protein
MADVGDVCSARLMAVAAVREEGHHGWLGLVSLL